MIIPVLDGISDFRAALDTGTGGAHDRYGLGCAAHKAWAQAAL
jgi:hypothetical protein